MIPIIIHPGVRLSGAATLSDIMFLAKKEFDGKLVTDEGFNSVAGDLATLTASSGKDMYIARAKVVFFSNAIGTVSAVADEVNLQINGTVVETVKYSYDNVGEGGVLAFAYDFKNIGYKVAATQIIKLEVITLDAETDVEGFIECFEETTGATPVI